MKGRASHPSPSTALSFPDSKKVPIYCWGDEREFSSLSDGETDTISGPPGNFLHHNLASLTTHL